MATLTIKKLSDNLYEALKASAAAHHRSIVAEATVLLERGLGHRRHREEELLTRAEQLRRQTSAYITHEDVREAIDEGRA